MRPFPFFVTTVLEIYSKSKGEGSGDLTHWRKGAYYYRCRNRTPAGMPAARRLDSSLVASNFDIEVHVARTTTQARRFPEIYQKRVSY